MFSRKFREAYNLNKYSAISRTFPYSNMGHNVKHHYTTGRMTIYAVVFMCSVSLFTFPDVLYEIFVHFREPYRQPLFHQYPKELTEGNVALMERMRLHKQVDKFVKKFTAYSAADYTL